MKRVIIIIGVCCICLNSCIYTPVPAQTTELSQYQADDLAIDTVQSNIVYYAQKFVGNSYVYGGNSLTTGIDCSHFVWQVLKNTGHYNGLYTSSDGWISLGQQVSCIECAAAGDIFVYSGHVAIYDGAGKLIEALNETEGITDYRAASEEGLLAIRRFY